MSTQETCNPQSSPKIRTASCNCGKLTFQVTAEKPIFTTLCHCRNCRKGTGAPVSMVIAVPIDQFQWKACADSGLTTEQLVKEVPLSSKFNGYYCGECCGFMAQGLVGVLPFMSTMGCCYDEMRNAFCPKELIKQDSFFQPISHVNYENRVIDIPDKLPKFLDFDKPYGSGRLFDESTSQ